MPRGAGRIGWWLVWSVVFCDIGTSVYYVPGVLDTQAGAHAGLFVLGTSVAFVLLCLKQIEVVRRFPSGEGVVAVGDRALGPWWGCLGGQFILVDFFLTIAISAASGMYYLDSLLPLGEWRLPATVLALLLLTAVNVVGVKESVLLSFALAAVAFVVDLAVIVAALVKAGPGVVEGAATLAGEVRVMSGTELLLGYGGAWLAFAGLESTAQIAPAMKDLGATPRRGLFALAGSVVLTAPLLTFLATAVLPAAQRAGHDDALISALAGWAGGAPLKAAAALSAATLLLFAANTAIIASYHVVMALCRREFLPGALGELSARYQTPSRGILLATGVAIVLVLVTGGRIHALAGLYAFGLLGAFLLDSVGIDRLRWQDGERGGRFWLGVFTSLLVLVAFVSNLVARPDATLFGGGLAGVGLLVAVATRRGWWARLGELLPGLHPPEAAEQTGVGFKTLAAAQALVEEGDPPGILVASRGAGAKIFKEAVERARARGQRRVFLVYVDEVPGLFYPQLGGPTPEGQRVLDQGMTALATLGVEPVPVWMLSHSAAGSVAEAAETLGCDTVVIGATQRTILWQALRGKFIQDLLEQLPPRIRLVVVG